MKIKFLGHASFLLTTDEGVRIITDPYQSGSFGGQIGYGPVNEEADVVLISHEHDDHNYTADILGSPQVLKTEGKVKGIEFKAVPTYHDLSQGSERGRNTIFVFKAGGMTICHAGDLGHQLTERQAKDVGRVDILLVPVGGVFTIDAKGAEGVAESLQAKVIIPMHFKTPKCGFPLAEVDEFIRGKPGVRKIEGSEVEIKSSELPEHPEIIVLTPAL